MLKPNDSIGVFIFFLLGLILLTCSQKAVEPQTIPVTVSILVLHKAVGLDPEQFLPTQGAWVQLFNRDGSPIDPQRLFKQETDRNGKAVFKEDNDVFLPKASYKIRIFYFNSKTITDYFTVPQFPNWGTEYLIEKTIHHNIGDSLYTAAKPVRIVTKVTEKDPNTGQFIPSINALVSILKPDGSPILPDFTYRTLTDSNGIAEIIANDLYLLPEWYYKARVEKSDFTPVEVPFQIPLTPNYENSYLIQLEAQLID